MPKNLIFLDFETYYDNEFSLRRMTSANYILDPRFEMIMCAVKANDGPHEIVDGPDFPKWLAQFDPADTTTVTFNALFDNSILAWRYGFVPHTMIDAMAMARTLLGHKLYRFSLAHIAEYLGQPPKGTAINDVKGMRRADIKAIPYLWTAFMEYAKHDNELCEYIFNKLYPSMPWSERRLMDMVLRCCVEPRFMVDTAMLEAHIDDVKGAKEQLIIDAGNVDKKTIMSTKLFKEALESMGVDIQYKESPSALDEYGAPKLIPAFSKTDEFMEELQNDADPKIAAMAAARVGLKSTLEETRSVKLLSIGMLDWPRAIGTMPIPLRYGGAHTHRLSGDWGMNMQNMPTVRGSKGKSKLRLSLKAPPGHTVITCDLGQIEARLVAWICGDKTLLREFAEKLDPYNQLASSVFGRPVNRKLVGTEDEIMGFIGKTGILGLGYGCGKDKFHAMVVRSARAQGVDISQIYNQSVGERAWRTYRKRYFKIPDGWYHLDYIVTDVLANPSGGRSNFGPCVISHQRVLLPSGLTLEYDNLQAPSNLTGGHRSYTYRYGKKRHTLYGAKLLENITQALARIIVMNAALRIRDKGKMRPDPQSYRFVLQAHDELVYIVPNDELEFAKKLIHEEMTRPPSWGKDIPLVADIGTGNSYGEAK
jgi:DNA polymerase